MELKKTYNQSSSSSSLLPPLPCIDRLPFYKLRLLPYLLGLPGVGGDLGRPEGGDCVLVRLVVGGVILRVILVVRRPRDGEGKEVEIERRVGGGLCGYREGMAGSTVEGECRDTGRWVWEDEENEQDGAAVLLVVQRFLLSAPFPLLQLTPARMGRSVT